MEIRTENEKKLFNIIVSIAEEIGVDKKHLQSCGPYEIQSVIIKDFHIARILKENDKKSLKLLKRELDALRQRPFPFDSHMQRYA